ncbi:MAG: hypothetical protein P1U39_08950 [Legionellaceae bacterium]|nr:hypothetical protein [Legionellaceae bacterium]
MGANQDKNKDVVLRAIGRVEETLARFPVVFEQFRHNAASDREVLDGARALERSFVNQVREITAHVQHDYAQGKITAEQAVFFLERADEVVYRVMHKQEVFPALFDMQAVGKRTVNLDKVRSEVAYKKAGQHAIMGLITTLAIVGTVIVALALTGPSLGASLLLLLSLALSGAGCGIPRALQGCRLHLKSERDEAEYADIPENKISGYAQHLQKAYAALRPDDQPAPRDGEEHDDSPKCR